MYELKINKLNQNANPATEPMSVAKFIGKLFFYKTALHFLHLKVSGTGAYAAHKALNDLYDFVEEIYDTLAETAQTESLLELCHDKICSSDVSTNTVMEFCEFVRENRHVFPYPFQQNLIDELESKIASTKYKMKFLQ